MSEWAHFERDEDAYSYERLDKLADELDKSGAFNDYEPYVFKVSTWRLLMMWLRECLRFSGDGKL